MAEENQEESNVDAPGETSEVATDDNSDSSANDASASASAAGGAEVKRAHRSQKVGVITSDKMQKTVVVRVDRLVRHTKYRRYVRRTSKFMAHDELGSTVGDKVRIVETRPMSARKRWRVIEIVQKAAK
ncbi:MAG: 30S ribosomal protein S17 [Pyrinomonadaceae bacterium]|nr:30S ribosomal protein S17 [Pyrinomonadaceae bacterium]